MQSGGSDAWRQLLIGRSLSLLDPTYASKYIPIIASVSEHQPPAWPAYFTDLNILARFPLSIV